MTIMEIGNLDTFLETLRNDCQVFFDKLAEKLGDDWTVVSGMQPNGSRYLVRRGDECYITWDGKPVGSFRVSNHWNWRAKREQCSDHGYIQCFTRDMLPAKRRTKPWECTRPIMANSVGYFGSDLEYHVVYGEFFDWTTKKWMYKICSVDEAISIMMHDLYQLHSKSISEVIHEEEDKHAV